MNKYIDLKEFRRSGLHIGPSEYFADDKKITREEFQEIKNKAIRLECMSNAQNGGSWTFYTTAVMCD